MKESLEVTTQLRDFGDQEVEIGIQVEMVTCKIRTDMNDRGIINYGYKFRSVLNV